MPTAAPAGRCPAAPTGRPAIVAILYMLCAVTCFAALDTGAKVLTTLAGLPLAQVVWLRFASNMALNVAVLGARRELSFRSRRPWLQVARCTALAATTLLNFAALQTIQLDQTASIFFLGPLVVAAFAGPMLGEWIGWRRLVAVLVGFVGALVILQPDTGGIGIGASFAVGAVLTHGLYVTLTRLLARHDASAVTQSYTPLAGFVGGLLPAVALWQTPAEWWALPLACLLGAFGGFGHWLLILAHARAPAPHLAPFGYFQLLPMAVLGWLVFGAVPSGATLLGAGIILVSGLYLIRAERAPGER